MTVKFSLITRKLLVNSFFYITLLLVLGSQSVQAGLLLSLDASTLGLTNEQAVTSWGPATASGTPTFLTGQSPNGSSAVQFNGADHFGQLGASLFPASASQDFIIAAVIKANSINAYHNIIDDDATARPMLWIDSAFRYELNYGGGNGAVLAGTGLDGWDIVIANSRTNQLYVNSATANASGGVGGGGSYTAPAAFDLFNRDGGQTFQGLVSELRIYNDEASFGNDYSALYNELNDKWLATSAIPTPSTFALFLLGLFLTRYHMGSPKIKSSLKSSWLTP